MQWLIENTGNAELIRKLAERVCVETITLDYLMNQSSSCVLQALIEATLKILSKESSSPPTAANASNSQRQIKWTTHWLHDIGKLCAQNLNQLMEDSNGSHVMTTILEALGGIRIGRQWSRKTMGFGMKNNIQAEIEKDMIMKELPVSFKHLLKRFAKGLVLERNDRELKDIILGKGTSLVQYLLFILKVRYHELCQVVVKRLAEVIFQDDESKFAITTSSVSAYLVEAVILVASDHRLTRVWSKHLKGNLKRMWKHDIANFIVQRLIDATQTHPLVRLSLSLLSADVSHVSAVSDVRSDRLYWPHYWPHYLLVYNFVFVLTINIVLNVFVFVLQSLQSVTRHSALQTYCRSYAVLMLTHDLSHSYRFLSISGHITSYYINCFRI